MQKNLSWQNTEIERFLYLIANQICPECDGFRCSTSLTMNFFFTCFLEKCNKIRLKQKNSFKKIHYFSIKRWVFWNEHGFFPSPQRRQICCRKRLKWFFSENSFSFTWTDGFCRVRKLLRLVKLSKFDKIVFFSVKGFHFLKIILSTVGGQKKFSVGRFFWLNLLSVEGPAARELPEEPTIGCLVGEQ